MANSQRTVGQFVVRAMAEVKQTLDSTEPTRKVMRMVAGSKGSHDFVIAGAGESLTRQQHAHSALVVEKVFQHETVPELAECRRRSERAVAVARCGCGESRIDSTGVRSHIGVIVQFGG